MENLNYIFTVCLIELIVDFLVLKVFKIKYKLPYIVFLQVPKICANLLTLIYVENVLLCIAIKYLALLICVFFLSDEFNIKRMFKLQFLELVLLFSISGFSWFLKIWIKALFKCIFKVEIAENYNFLIEFLIFLYIFVLFWLIRNIEKNRFFKRHLVKVSLNLWGKHICFSGLIDSGNSLNDPYTCKPVILISLKSIRKYFSDEEIKSFMNFRCRKIKCETIQNSCIEIPVDDLKNIEILENNGNQKIDAVVGFIEQSFENGKFDCLLHRDFL